MLTMTNVGCSEDLEDTINKINMYWAVVVHAFSLSSGEAEVGQVNLCGQGQLSLHFEVLPPNKHDILRGTFCK